VDNGRCGWARQSLRLLSRYHSLIPVGPEWDAIYLGVPTDNVEHPDPAAPPNGNITIPFEVSDFDILGAVTVDSYAFLPRALRTMFEAAPRFEHEPVRTDFAKPLTEARIGLLSSAGIFVQGEQDGFDIERERQEPTWGDPTLRPIRANVSQAEIDALILAPA
jgi:hypothetical protein